jgi:hypothetical protein
MYLKVGMPEANDYDVIDLNTNQKIPCVQEADDITGDFSLLLYDIANGECVYNKEKREFVEFHFKGNIKLVKKEVK